MNRYRIHGFIFCLFFAVLYGLIYQAVNLNAQEAENLNVLERWIDWSHGETMLVHHLNRLAYECLDRRENEIAQLKTKEDWENRQKKVRRILDTIVGPFPTRTPLEPVITGTLDQEGYRVEKILFESMPDYFVSGCLFIPDGITGKRPAILNPIGHSVESFRKEGYQILIHNLVRKGFIVFAIDPMGQGERIQYTDEEKKQVGLYNQSPTREHSYAANQCFLPGSSLAKYWVWDGIRAVDYLLTRDEVDSERIGLTGLSGGGTATAYISAFDDRIRAAAPACYITGYRRLLQSIGPQDGEQNFYHGLSGGIDHADLIEVFAPKPYLIVATTRDFFSIQGVRETYREVKKAYRAFGKEAELRKSEDDLGHGYTPKNREAIYRFFQETLDWPGDPSDEQVETIPMQDLQITPTGQILTSFKSETVFSVNRELALERIRDLERSRKNTDAHLRSVRQKAEILSGYRNPAETEEPVFRGRYRRDGYAIEMYGVAGEGDCVIPVLLMIPDGIDKAPAIIYLHPEGKAKDIAPGGPLESLVRRGCIVASADVIGCGETKGNSTYPGNPGYSALIIGRSIPGIQAGDIVRVARWLKGREDVNGEDIGAVATGELCPALLHAGVFEPLLRKIVLIDSPLSYGMMVTNKLYSYSFSFSWGVAGALTAYDLPDLMGCLAPGKLLLAGLRDPLKNPASPQQIGSELAFVRSVFALRTTAENIQVMDTILPENMDSIADWWLK